MQRVILENQGFVPRKLSNPAPEIKDLARFCQTGNAASPLITKTRNGRPKATRELPNLGRQRGLDALRNIAPVPQALPTP